MIYYRCIFHGDLRKSCYITPPNANRDTKNFRNESFGSLNDKFYKQSIKLRNIGCDVVVIYECDYLNNKRNQNSASDNAIRKRAKDDHDHLSNRMLIPR